MYRRGIEQVREAKSSREKKDKAVSFLKKWLRKKYSSSRQSSETKPNAKLVLVNCEPLHYLEFNRLNKQNVPEINSVNKFNFSPSQNNC